MLEMEAQQRRPGNRRAPEQFDYGEEDAEQMQQEVAADELDYGS